MAKRLSDEQLIELVEAAIFVAQAPLSKDKLRATVLEDFEVSAKRVQQALDSITAHYSTRGVRLAKVGSGYRFQACSSLSPWLGKLWQDKSPRYSRAFLETLSLIAYRQPITRGEIEQVRGVAVSSQTIKTMLEHNWIKVIGHKDPVLAQVISLSKFATRKPFEFNSSPKLSSLISTPIQELLFSTHK